MSEPLLDHKTLRLALQSLAARLHDRGIVGNVYLFGGGAMVLAFDTRPATRDLDGRFAPDGPLQAEALQVAAELGLPAARGGLVGDNVRVVVTVDEAARMALELPQVTEGERHGHRTWSVAGKGFAWERGFSKADIRRFGDAAPPEGPILAVRVADLGEKEAVLAAHPDAFFTIPHFEGYSAVLIQLKAVTKRALRDAIVDGWLACAPAPLADEYMAKPPGRGRVRRR